MQWPWQLGSPTTATSGSSVTSEGYIQKLESSLIIEKMNVKTRKENLAKMKEDMVILEMQAAEAGNGKMV